MKHEAIIPANDDIRTKAFMNTRHGTQCHSVYSEKHYELYEKGGSMYVTSHQTGETWVFPPGTWHGSASGPPKKPGRPSA